MHRMPFLQLSITLPAKATPDVGPERHLRAALHRPAKGRRESASGRMFLARR